MDLGPDGLGFPVPEYRIGRNFDGHYLSTAKRAIVQLAAVTAPVRVNPSSIRDLPLATPSETVPAELMENDRT